MAVRQLWYGCSTVNLENCDILPIFLISVIFNDLMGVVRILIHYSEKKLQRTSKVGLIVDKL